MSIKEGSGSLDVIVQVQIEVMSAELEDNERNCQIEKHCKHTKKANASCRFQTTRWNGHFVKCKDCPLGIKKQIAENGNANLKQLAVVLELHLKGLQVSVAGSSPLTTVTTVTTAAANSMSPLQPVKKRAQFDAIVDSVGRFVHCSKEQAEKINEVVMMFIAGFAILFIIVGKLF